VTRCSEYATALAEPLAATAPEAQAWLLLEQPGPWGRQALTDSHLDSAVGAELADRSTDIPLTVLLVRRIGRHADTHVTNEPRQVWVAYTGGPVGVGSWLRHAVVDDPGQVLDVDLAAVAAGHRPDLGEPDPRRLLLVCTNARRDTCCALLGRPVAVELARRHPGRVWESSHLGGHRFAPSVLSLPDGFVYGGPHAIELGLAACRGRSALGRPAQAAELAVLAADGSSEPSPLDVSQDGTGWVVRSAGAARHADVTAVARLPLRPESCGKDPVEGTTFRVGSLASPV
jgi:hypothetical protein